MDNDNFNEVPSNISSIIDVLEDKGVSWGHYQEDMPYTGFEGFAWVNQQTHANDYVRKHSRSTCARNQQRLLRRPDPAIIYGSVIENPDRLANIKNLTMFYDDLANNKLPQWMFITPNMSKPLHDSHSNSCELMMDSERWPRHIRDHCRHVDAKFHRASAEQPKLHEEHAGAYHL